MKSYYNT